MGGSLGSGGVEYNPEVVILHFGSPQQAIQEEEK